MLSLKKVGKKFGNNRVLENINLNIDRGKIISILGSSGSGKTTLLNLILGLEEPTEGEIFLEGENITNLSMEKRPFNIVFQDYALFPNLNAYDNLTYGIKRNERSAKKSEVDELIELLDLKDHLNKTIQKLSGGQKQRVALGRTLITKPKILLLDEPLSALDGVIKEKIKEQIKNISKELGMTTIIVTHDPEEALTMSDKILVLNKGTVSQYSSPKQIIRKPSNDFIDNFIVKQLNIKKRNIDAIFIDSKRELAL